MPQRVEGSIEIQQPVAEVYDYWETLENLPYFMKNVEEVLSTGPDTTHWRIKGPFGATVEFDARTTEREPNSALSWTTIGGEVGTSGEIRFNEISPDASRVDVILNYFDPPGGKLGERVSRLISDPQLILAQDLENLKDVLEGTITPEEVQQDPVAANVQLAVVSIFGVVVAVLGVTAVVLILRWLGGGRVESDREAGPLDTASAPSSRKLRFIARH